MPSCKYSPRYSAHGGAQRAFEGVVVAIGRLLSAGLGEAFLVAILLGDAAPALGGRDGAPLLAGTFLEPCGGLRAGGAFVGVAGAAALPTSPTSDPAGDDDRPGRFGAPPTGLGRLIAFAQ